MNIDPHNKGYRVEIRINTLDMKYPLPCFIKVSVNNYSAIRYDRQKLNGIYRIDSGLITDIIGENDYWDHEY